VRNLVPSIGASVLGILFENLLSTRKIMRLPVSNQISKKVAQPDAVINLAPANASILGILSNHVISTSAQLSSLGFKQEKKGSSTRAKRVISTGGKRATFLGVRKGYPTEARNTGPAYWTIPTLTPDSARPPLPILDVLLQIDSFKIKRVNSRNGIRLRLSALFGSKTAD